MFMGPPEQDSDWNDTGIEGVYRFLTKVWAIAMKSLECNPVSRPEVVKETHKLIKGVVERLENQKVNTALVVWLVSVIIPVRRMDSYFVSGIVVGVVLWAGMNLIFTAIGITPTWSVGVGSFIINLISHVAFEISITYALLKYKARSETTT